MSKQPLEESCRFMLRQATLADLPSLEQFAAASEPGITTLQADHELLHDRLERSAHAFSTEDDASGEEIYQFVVEDTQRGVVVGTSGIAAAAGFADRFYSFRSEFVVHASKALGTSNRTHTLHLCHDLTGVTLLTSFYIEPEYEQSVAAQLLSRGRLLFLAEFADRFSDRIAAENPGLGEEGGRCPFWDAVGRRFFGMDYPAVERLAVGRSKSFIGDLMPRSPIYVPLLPADAQWAIGQLHPVAELPFSILIDEGFDPDTYIDIFDGGPTVHGRLGALRSVSRSRVLRRDAAVASAASSIEEPAGSAWLVATTRRDRFRATVVHTHQPRRRADLDWLSGVAPDFADAAALRVAPLGSGTGDTP